MSNKAFWQTVDDYGDWLNAVEMVKHGECRGSYLEVQMDAIIWPNVRSAMAAASDSESANGVRPLPFVGPYGSGATTTKL